jgi:maltose O-acetyltransferase
VHPTIQGGRGDEAVLARVLLRRGASPAGLLAMQYGREPWDSVSNRFRVLAARRLFRKLALPVESERGAWFGDGSRVEMGNRSMIGEDCRINNVILGRDVLMEPEAIITRRQHSMGRGGRPIREQPMREFSPVRVGDNVRIGTRVIIMPGLRIGEGSVLAADVVVTTDVEPFAIVGGVPARKIGSR